MNKHEALIWLCQNIEDWKDLYTGDTPRGWSQLSGRLDDDIKISNGYPGDGGIITKQEWLDACPHSDGESVFK